MLGRSHSITFNENNQEIAFSGSLRPRTGAEISNVAETIKAAVWKVSGTLFLNFKRLQYLNNTAFVEIARAVQLTTTTRPNLKIKIIVSSVVPWALQKLQPLTEISKNVTLEQYDKKFYPGQGVVENQLFIPVLRTQTKIIWGQERHVLVRHGLRKGMKIADVCCGIGDFAALVYKEFQPNKLVAVDHSRPSLRYAREVAHEFGIDDIDFQYGDASNLMIPDNSFDFVMCRLSLQVFDKPELILRELFRICDRGGRVYVTNETYSNTFGSPREKSIAWTYQEASRLFATFGIDLEFGQKMRGPLVDCKFDDIRIEPMILTNLNSDNEDFAEVVRSWESYISDDLARAAGATEELRAKLKSGFQDHLDAISSRRGFAGWPIWVGSGRKPYG
jgi:ubiquinone/menaquinone biosynthesis C-methylase UbiE